MSLNEFKALNESQVSEMLGISVAKLRRDRWLNIGIPYTKWNRSVRYMLRDVEAAIERNRVKTER